MRKYHEPALSLVSLRIHVAFATQCAMKGLAGAAPAVLTRLAAYKMDPPHLSCSSPLLLYFIWTSAQNFRSFDPPAQVFLAACTSCLASIMSRRSSSAGSRTGQRSRSQSRNAYAGPCSLTAIAAETARMAQQARQALFNINNARADPILSVQIDTAVRQVEEYSRMIVGAGQAQQLRDLVKGSIPGKPAWASTALSKLEPAITFRFNADKYTQYYRSPLGGLSRRYPTGQNLGILAPLLGNIVASTALTQDGKV